MKYKISRASNRSLLDYPGIEYNPDAQYSSDRYTIEINDVSDLIKLEKDFDCSLIVSFKHHQITIYDGYVE